MGNNTRRTNNMQNASNAQANAEPHYHGPTANIFDSFNDRLVANGFPRWNISSYVVEPIVSIGFIAALLLIGVHGLIFALGLFFIVKWGGVGNNSNNSHNNATSWTPGSNRDKFGNGSKGYRLDS